MAYKSILPLIFLLKNLLFVVGKYWVKEYLLFIVLSINTWYILTYANITFCLSNIIYLFFEAKLLYLLESDAYIIAYLFSIPPFFKLSRSNFYQYRFFFLTELPNLKKITLSTYLPKN